MPRRQLRIHSKLLGSRQQISTASYLLHGNQHIPSAPWQITDWPWILHCHRYMVLQAAPAPHRCGCDIEFGLHQSAQVRWPFLDAPNPGQTPEFAVGRRWRSFSARSGTMRHSSRAIAPASKRCRSNIPEGVRSGHPTVPHRYPSASLRGARPASRSGRVRVVPAARASRRAAQRWCSRVPHLSGVSHGSSNQMVPVSRSPNPAPSTTSAPSLAPHSQHAAVTVKVSAIPTSGRIRQAAIHFAHHQDLGPAAARLAFLQR